MATKDDIGLLWLSGLTFHEAVAKRLRDHQGETKAEIVEISALCHISLINSLT